MEGAGQERGRREVGGMMLLPGQAVGMCGVEEGIVEVMVGRRHSFDDEKGLEEGLDDNERGRVGIGVLVGGVEAGENVWQDVKEGRRIGGGYWGKVLIVIGSGLGAESVGEAEHRWRKKGGYFGVGGASEGSSLAGGDDSVEVVGLQYVRERSEHMELGELNLHTLCTHSRLVPPPSTLALAHLLTLERVNHSIKARRSKHPDPLFAPT